jgi:hypothetical protein
MAATVKGAAIGISIRANMGINSRFVGNPEVKHSPTSEILTAPNGLQIALYQFLKRLFALRKELHREGALSPSQRGP